MSRKLNLGRDLYIKGRIGWRGLSKDEYLSSGPYKIINATALMDGYIDWKNCGYISKDRYYESDEIMLQDGDILISKDGTIGKIGYVKDLEGFCTVASGIFVLRNEIPDELNFDYLYHILKSHIFKDFVNRNKATGSTINHLYQRDLENFEILLPDIEEQNKISAILNMIDGKIDTNTQINRVLESLAKTIYDYWFLQFDFPNKEGKPYKSSGGAMVWNKDLKMEIPEGWEVLNASDIARIDTGDEDANHSTLNGKYPFFTCSNEILRCDDYVFDGKAVLIAGNGDFNVKSYEGKFNAYQRTYVVMPKAETNSLYGMLYFSTLYNIERFRKGSNGSIVKYITKSDVENIKIIKPQDDVDIGILNNILSLIQHNQEENEKLALLRDFLLPLLMNGQAGFKDE